MKAIDWYEMAADLDLGSKNKKDLRDSRWRPSDAFVYIFVTLSEAGNKVGVSPLPRAFNIRSTRSLDEPFIAIRTRFGPKRPAVAFGNIVKGVLGTMCDLHELGACHGFIFFIARRLTSINLLLKKEKKWVVDRPSGSAAGKKARA